MAVKKEVLEKGVERRSNHYRFRFREPYYEGGVKKFRAHVETFEFRPLAECRANKWPKNHDMWPDNARADANAASRRFHDDRKRDEGNAKARPVVQGSLREWLERYRDEGLKGHAYGDPDKKAPFPMEPRSPAGRTHDIGQINTLLRMGGFAVPGDEEVKNNPRRNAAAKRNRPEYSADIARTLECEVPALHKAHFKIILSKWSRGTAKPKTKRRLRTTLRDCLSFHSENYGMEADKDWLGVTIVSDGEPSKARALTRGEWSKVDAAISASRMHPSVEAALRFIRWTGCRLAEATGLKWEQVTWPKAGLQNAQPSVKFLRTKAARGNYKERTIAIPDEAIEALRLAAGIGPQSTDWPTKGWVFPQPKPGEGRLAGQDHVSGQTVYTALKRLFVAKGQKMPTNAATVAEGVKPISPHHLRHHRATELSVGMPEQQMMEYFGWDDRETVKIYRHLAEEMGLLVRDADNLLRPVAQLESEQNVREYGLGLTLKQQEALVAKMAADLAERKATSKRRKKA